MFRTTVLTKVALVLLRNYLSAATALVLCASTVFADQETNPARDRLVPRQIKPWTPIRTGNAALARVPTSRNAVDQDIWSATSKITFTNLSKDKNAEFISWYGFKTQSSVSSQYFSSHSWFKEDTFVYNAAPFTGAGKKVSKIGAPVPAGMNLGIYSATPSGVPGQEIAGGSTTSSGIERSLGGINWVNVDIFLNAGQQYFFSVRCASSPCDGYWAAEDTDFSGEIKDYIRSSETECYNTAYSGGTQCFHGSPSWHISDYYPVVGAFIVK